MNSIFSKLDLPQPQDACHRVTLMFLSEEEDGVPLCVRATVLAPGALVARWRRDALTPADFEPRDASADVVKFESASE